MLVAGSCLLASATLGQDLDDARQLYHDGQWPEAAEAFLAAAASPEFPPEDRARALNNACVVFNDLGKHRRAATACREALELRRQIDDPRRLARVLNNLGLSERYLGDLEAGRRAFAEALQINRQLGDVAQEVVNLANLGALETEAGSFTEALAHHRLVERLAGEHPQQPWAAEQLWISRVNQGVALELAGAYRPALLRYRQALADEHLVTIHRRANLRVNLGVVYRNLGDPQQAVEAFTAAAELFRQLGDGSGRANALLNLGLAYHLNLARPVDAAAALNEALDASRLGGVKTEELRSLGQLGRLHLDQGRLQQAEESFQEQLRVATDSGSESSRWQAESGLGQVLVARGQLDQALPYLLRAIDGIEQQQSGLADNPDDSDPDDTDLRWTFLTDNRAIYSAAIEVLAELDIERPGQGFAERALTIVQQAKARELLEALDRRQQGQVLRSDILPGAPSDAAELLAQADNDLVLEFYFTASGLWLWQIGNGAIQLQDLGPLAPINKAVRQVHQALAAGDPPPAAALSHLSAALLGPLSLTAPASDTLRIAPDGLLHYLPFELLAASDSNDGEQWVDRWSITYLSSASALGERRTPPYEGLLGLADPRLEPLPELPETPRELLIERFHLAPLPAAAQELRQIAGRWPGSDQLAFAEQATESRLRLALAEPRQIVHLASHAVLDERPGGSALIVLGADLEHDGLLYPREIAELDMAVGLTVLSACRTALEDDQGRALSSLAGAFLAGGSAAVIATLWDVDDQASAVFMEQLYHFLGRGLAPADALRQAKLRLRSDPDWDRPSVWAAYVLVGDVGPLVEKRRLAWLLIATVAAVLAALGAWWLRVRGA